MFGVLADQGSGPSSPLTAASTRRLWCDRSTQRSQSTPDVDMYGKPLFLDSNKAIVDATEKIADDRGVPMAQVAHAWVVRNPVVDSGLSGATK